MSVFDEKWFAEDDRVCREAPLSETQHPEADSCGCLDLVLGTYKTNDPDGGKCGAVQRARLASAAPDMYRAIVAALPAIDAWEGCSEWDGNYIHAALFEALRKARGE